GHGLTAQVPCGKKHEEQNKDEDDLPTADAVTGNKRVQKNHRMHNELLWMPGHKIVNRERGNRSLHRFKTREDRKKRDDLPGSFVRAGYLLRGAPFSMCHALNVAS